MTTKIYLTNLFPFTDVISKRNLPKNPTVNAQLPYLVKQNVTMTTHMNFRKHEISVKAKLKYEICCSFDPPFENCICK